MHGKRAFIIYIIDEQNTKFSMAFMTYHFAVLFQAFYNRLDLIFP